MKIIDKLLDGIHSWFDPKFAHYVSMKALYYDNFKYKTFEYPPFHRWRKMNNKQEDIILLKVMTAINQCPKNQEYDVDQKIADMLLGHIPITTYFVGPLDGDIRKFALLNTEIKMTTVCVFLKRKDGSGGDYVNIGVLLEAPNWRFTITNRMIDYSKPVNMYDDIMFVQGDIDQFEEDMTTLILTS